MSRCKSITKSNDYVKEENKDKTNDIDQRYNNKSVDLPIEDQLAILIQIITDIILKEEYESRNK
jgi:hypothetical protein